jgi:hypothetical protein
MQVRQYLGIGIGAGVLMVFSCAALAQATPKTESKKPVTSTAAETSRKIEANSISSAHQDQFGHASGVGVNAICQQAMSSIETKKHLVGVKSEDRLATQATSVALGQLDAKGTQEKSLKRDGQELNKRISGEAASRVFED